MSAQLEYRVPRSDLQTWIARWRCDWDALLRSAEITAEAHGKAYLVVTRSDGRSCGGKVYVTTDPEARAFGLPVTVLVVVEPATAPGER